MQKVWYFETPTIGYCIDCEEIAIWTERLGLHCPKCRTTDVAVFVWDGVSKYPGPGAEEDETTEEIEVTVYPGNNRLQEFFEDTDSQLALIRNHGDRDRWKDTEHKDRGWWAHGNEPFRAWYPEVQGTLKEVLKGLEENYGIKVTIDLTKMWVLPFKKAKNMKLVDTEERPNRPCPRCSSSTIWYWHTKAPQSTVMRCDHCGYIGFHPLLGGD